MIFIGREGFHVPSHLMVSVLFKEASEILLSVSSWQGSQDSFFCTGKWSHWVYCFLTPTRKLWAVVKDGIPVIIWTPPGHRHGYHGFSSRYARAREVYLFGGDDGFQQAVGGAFSCRARGPMRWTAMRWMAMWGPSPGGKNGEKGDLIPSPHHLVNIQKTMENHNF